MTTGVPSVGVRVLVTCEHGGFEIPNDWKARFAGADEILRSHRGWDPGALDVASRLASNLNVPLIHSTTSRLLVELNRSPDHPDLFSEFMRDVPTAGRDEVLRSHYHPHRDEVERSIRRMIDEGHRVLHIGVHSFVDVLDGRERAVEIGLLFDPARAMERDLCTRWLEALERERPDWRHRMNEPYLGTDDGLTTCLRTRFADESYAGIEVEIRQGLLVDAESCIEMGDLLARTVLEACPSTG